MPEIITRKDARARGLPWYFTGRECKHGHVSEHYVGNAQCRRCCNEAARARTALQYNQGRITHADPERGFWTIKCGKAQFIDIGIGDIDDQRNNVPRMVVGAKVEFDLTIFDGESFLENVSVVS